ncbi:hypothetical protein ACVU7I_13925, partial [Patulibacter sp. S7RM1-6]
MRNRFSPIPFLVAALVALAVVPAGASADYRKVYDQCTSGDVDASFSAKELQQALQNLEGNLGDYSDCADAIARARARLASGKSQGGGSSSGGGGSTG